MAGDEENRRRDLNTLVVVGGFTTMNLGCIGFILFVVTFMAEAIILLGIARVMWPLILFCKLIPVCDGGGSSGNNDVVAEVVAGNGTGDLFAPSVPADLLAAVRKAGRKCSEIGPIVIAAQIQLESGWNAKLVGPNGEKGISQLPPDKFDEFGEDEDDNDTTSALDPEDSIVAQGAYMCSLAEQIGELLRTGQAEGDRLDLTLAAYDLGLDRIKQAKGIPEGSPVNGYVMGVRSSFPVYAGAVAPRDGEEYPSYSPFPSEPPDGQ